MRSILTVLFVTLAASLHAQELKKVINGDISFHVLVADNSILQGEYQKKHDGDLMGRGDIKVSPLNP